MATICLSQGLKTLGLRPWRVAYRLSATCARAKHQVFRLILATKVAVIQRTLASFDINNIGATYSGADFRVLLRAEL